MNLSGNLAPELGQLSYLKILDVMWNQLYGSIPREMCNIKTLELLLLNGNQFSGPLPEELGYLPKLNRIQIDQNSISGQIPKSFALLSTAQHLDKSDVYGLGVVFLELLTGQQPISNGKNIVCEVTLAYQSGMMFSVIDSCMGPYPSECIEKFVSLAFRCCWNETDARPSMSEVVRELENMSHDTRF